MHLAQFIEILNEIYSERGDIEVVRLTHAGEVRSHPGPELANRHIRYKGQLTTYGPERSVPVVKV
jgi:hypothetical protein